MSTAGTSRVPSKRSAHLGLEIQREWSTRAVGRATPCLLELFSLVVLLAHALYPEDLPLGEQPGTRRPSPPSSMRLRPCAGSCGRAGIGYPWSPLLDFGHFTR